MEQLAKMIQGYEEKNNPTAEMMNNMRKMFDEKLQALERENKVLKEKANFKSRMEYSNKEKSSNDQRKRTEEGRKAKMSKGDIESPEDSVALSSRTINSGRTVQHVERDNARGKEKEKEINLMKLNEKLIKEVVKIIRRFSTNSPMDKAEEAMKGISISPFPQWIIKEVKPRNFNPLKLEKFQGKSDLVSHLLQFKQRISLEEITEGLICKLFLTTFTE